MIPPIETIAGYVISWASGILSSVFTQMIWGKIKKGKTDAVNEHRVDTVETDVESLKSKHEQLQTQLQKQEVALALLGVSSDAQREPSVFSGNTQRRKPPQKKTKTQPRRRSQKK